MQSILLQVTIYLAAAVIAVPLSRWLGFGSVLGYLAAGVAIGPALGLVGREAESVQAFAEYGVVLMLFLIGLEMRPRVLWDMRHRLVGLGGLQVVMSIALIAAVGGVGRAALERGDRRRDDPGALVDGDRAADAEREEADAYRGRAGEPRGAPVPGRGGGAAAGADAAARVRRGFGRGRRAARRRGARRGFAVDAGGAGLRGGRAGGGRGAVPDAGGLPLPRAGAGAGDPGRGRAAADHRRVAGDEPDRAVAGAGVVPRRGGAGELGVPASARGRPRAVQGAAARAVLHDGRGRRRPRQAGRGTGAAARADDGADRREDGGALAAGAAVPAADRGGDAVHAGAGAGGRVRLRAARLRRGIAGADRGAGRDRAARHRALDDADAGAVPVARPRRAAAGRRGAARSPIRSTSRGRCSSPGWGVSGRR